MGPKQLIGEIKLFIYIGFKNMKYGPIKEWHVGGKDPISIGHVYIHFGNLLANSHTLCIYF